MELVLEDAKFFKSCMDAIVNLVDEGSFEVSKSGLHLRTMDPSQIAMVDFTMAGDAFKKLSVDGPATLGINLIDLSKILSRARPSEKLSLVLDEKEANKLSLEFLGANKRTFKLPLLDLAVSSPKEPKIPFDAHVKMRGGAFKELLKDASLLSSHVSLEITSDKLFLEAHGDSGDLKAETEKGSSDIVELKSGAKARAMFPFEYLDDMTRACPDDETLSIELKSDAPLRLAYSIGGAKLAYYLAPRVETV
jgi:proliferating cell nuclear antigen